LSELTTDLEPGTECAGYQVEARAGHSQPTSAATAALIYPPGTIFETHLFTHGHAGPITIADRTWTCPDGSTLMMHVFRFGFIPETETTAHILESWVVTHGMGRLASLQGSGTMDEICDFGVEPETLGRSVVGLVR
jgi:hypothetical protein